MRLVDVFLSIPAILLAIITVAVLGPGLVNVIVVLALTRWPRYARVAYGQTLGVANMPYVRLSRFMGAGRVARALPPRAAQHHRRDQRGRDTGVRPDGAVRGRAVVPRPRRAAADGELGRDAVAGRNYLATAWWIATFPGLCLFLLVLAVNLIGDDLRDRLDPRSQ